LLDSAVTAAQQAAPYLTQQQTYIDLNSVSPATKRNMADQLRHGGAKSIEFAVMAPVSGVGIETPILSGGQTAEMVSARLNELGMKIRHSSRCGNARGEPYGHRTGLGRIIGRSHGRKVREFRQIQGVTRRTDSIWQKDLQSPLFRHHQFRRGWLYGLRLLHLS
jgi:hypothetical protein